MDTDHLSNECYDNIIGFTAATCPDVTCLLGVLAGHCTTEKEYIKEVQNFILDIEDSDEDDLDMIFFGIPPSEEKLIYFITTLKQNCQDLLAR